VNQCRSKGSLCFSAGISGSAINYSLLHSFFGFLCFAPLNELQTDGVVTESNQQMGFLKPHLTTDYTSGLMSKVSAAWSICL
jgi:hypothetical protein